MPKGRVITRSVTTSRPLNMTLNLECSEEPLSESQLMMRVKLKENYDRVAATLEELAKDHSGKLVCQAGSVNGYQYTMPPTSGQAMVKSTPQTVLNVNHAQTKAQAIKLNVLNNSGASSGNIQLVVDPRMGVILGQVSQPQGTTTTTASAISASAPTAHTQPETPAPPPVRARQKSSSSTHVVAPTTTTPQGVTNLRIKTVNKQQQQQQHQPPQATPQPQVVTKPTEHTSIGGIAVGSKYSASEHLDESRKNLPDGREVSFNKMNGGRTFPSLVVVARPNLRTKDTPLQIAQKERSELDMKVKSVLMFSATKFAEWLIQQGLVRSEQHCAQHSNAYHKVKLKLGMYSDQGTFPYSGGYVWISTCCPDRFVSVFSGSIFQGAPYTPTVLLKLIYHWACQTNVQNVVSWVKVSNVYVKNFYTHLRSVCTAALWEKCRKMGGENSTIQVGVISLGTTSQDGNLRQVKVEVLGVLDLNTLELRLRACDPVQDVERSYKRRFNNILYPLKDWVHTDSKIVTDYTVDKSTLQEMGFNYVTQSAFSEQNPRNIMSNYHIMEYLRKIVPRMFQNTLSLLSRQMIQQFLDELVWREMYGTTTARAFDNIILHIAEQTMLDVNDNLLDRLAKIAANPFQDWSYANFNTSQSLTSPITPSVHQEPVTTCTDTSISPIIVTTPASTSVSSSSASLPTAANTAQSIRSQQDVPNVKVGAKRGRKRVLPTTSNAESSESSKSTSEGGRSSLREKERDLDSKSLEQIQLQEFYYATMEGDKNLLLREHKSSVSLKCFLCPVIMRSNTQVMEHTIGHVPPQMPDQSESPVCRYCCTIFSSEHQMLTHVSETHSNFGQSESHMVVCAICEQKFATSNLLVDHLSSMHYPSEMPYRCDACGYRTSSHKDAVDHFYKIHELGDSLQCPYCLKVMPFVSDGKANVTGVHAFLLHMQRHVIRREQGKGNKCSRCCLWFNQKSSLKSHQRELHDGVTGSKVTPYSGGDSGIMIPRQRMQYRRFDVDSPTCDIPNDERIRKWTSGPITINGVCDNLACQECEEDIDEQDHYPAEQRCRQCRYITCCWRAFKEHQQQIHNERPMTSLTVPSPLINIPLEKKMQCPCGYGTTDGNRLASHLVKCKRVSAYPVEDAAPTGMLNSLGLVPKSTAEEVSLDGKKAGPR